MKHLLTALLLTGWAAAQSLPDFQFTLFARDAVGNVDSVVLGYTTQASSWENVPDTSRWDTVFEMRAAQTTSPGDVSAKRIILGTGGDCVNGPLWGSVNIPIQILVKNLPVTLFWDNDLFDSLSQDNFCRKSTFFLDYDMGLADPDMQAKFPQMPLVNFGGFYETNFIHRDTFATFWPFKVEVQTIAQDTDSAYELFFAFSSGWITDTDAPVEGPPFTLQVAGEELVLKTTQPLGMTTIQLLDLHGRRLREMNGFLSADGTAELPVGGLPPGMYLVQVQADGNSWYKRVILP